MSVVDVIVTLLGDQGNIVLVGNINNGQGVFVVAEAHFLVVEASIGTIINDTLGVMGVTIILIAS